jgi:hypothetical protein
MRTNEEWHTRSKQQTCTAPSKQQTSTAPSSLSETCSQSSKLPQLPPPGPRLAVSLTILSSLKDEVLGQKDIELRSGLGLGLELLWENPTNLQFAELGQSIDSSSLTILSSLRCSFRSTIRTRTRTRTRTRIFVGKIHKSSTCRTWSEHRFKQSDDLELSPK